MSKTNKLQVEQTPDNAAAGAEFHEQLAQMLGSTDDTSSDVAAIEHAAVNFVPESEVMTPKSFDDLEAARANAVFTRTDTGRGIATEKIMKHYDAATYNQFSEALGHKEKPSSGTAMMGHGKTAVPVPPDTRDNPAALYSFRCPRTNQVFKIRERADKLLNAIFGDTAWRVLEGAARSGFQQKPLVWVSQQVWHRLTLNKITKRGPSKWAAEQNDPNKLYVFNEAIDENESSPVYRAIGEFIAEITLQGLSMRARYEDVSILAVIRFVMWEVCNERGIPPVKPLPVQAKEAAANA